MKSLCDMLDVLRACFDGLLCGVSGLMLAPVSPLIYCWLRYKRTGCLHHVYATFTRGGTSSVNRGFPESAGGLYDKNGVKMDLRVDDYVFIACCTISRARLRLAALVSLLAPFIILSPGIHCELYLTL